MPNDPCQHCGGDHRAGVPRCPEAEADIRRAKRDGESNRRPRCGRCRSKPLYILKHPLTTPRDATERLATYECPSCFASLCRKEWKCPGCNRWVVDPLFHHRGD